MNDHSVWLSIFTIGFIVNFLCLPIRYPNISKEFVQLPRHSTTSTYVTNVNIMPHDVKDILRNQQTFSSLYYFSVIRLFSSSFFWAPELYHFIHNFSRARDNMNPLAAFEISQHYVSVLRSESLLMLFFCYCIIIVY